MYYSILFCFKFEGINNVILNNKIVLIGYMGSGKTAVGKELSKIFNIPFIDLDDEIVKVEKRSIDKIFEENGELYFRKVEHDCLKNILKSSIELHQGRAQKGLVEESLGDQSYKNELHDLRFY